MNRRGFLQAILASATAPYVVTTAGVLMPVQKIATPAYLTDPGAWFIVGEGDGIEVVRQGEDLAAAIRRAKIKGLTEQARETLAINAQYWANMHL